MKRLNPLNWEPGKIELLLSIYCLIVTFIVEFQSQEYYTYFILTILLAGVSTIRKDIYSLKENILKEKETNESK